MWISFDVQTLNITYFYKLLTCLQLVRIAF